MSGKSKLQSQTRGWDQSEIEKIEKITYPWWTLRGSFKIARCNVSNFDGQILPAKSNHRIKSKKTQNQIIG